MNSKIAGYENEKQELLQLRCMLHHAREYRERGLRIPRGVVLFGEPGIGKTVLARSIADEGIALLELNAADCCSQKAKDAIPKTFELAKQKAPCVLLLDDLDKVAGDSELFYMEDNDNVRKVLLQEIDALRESDEILVVATCNDLNCLGPALMRPGRFDRLISVDIPDKATRRKILALYFAKVRLEKQLDLDRIATLTSGYTGAQLECLVNEAGLNVLENRRSAITEADVRTVMDRQALQGRKKAIPDDPEEVRRTAVHEAGHALVAMVLMPENLFGATVYPQGDSAGHVKVVHSEPLRSVRQVEEEVTLLLGGRVAEMLVDGEAYLGSSRDLQAAVRRLQDLAEKHAAYGYRFLCGYSRRGQHELERIIETKMTMLAARAETILTERRDTFDRIVQALIERKSLSREELFGLFADEARQAA